MAVIGSIRKRSALLVIIIGVALAAFVLGDFARGGRSGRQEVNIGEVNGEEITYMDFNYKVDQNIQGRKQQQQKERLTADETFSLQNETWNQMVGDILLNDEYDELGLTVPVDELDDLIRGTQPHPLVLQSFTDPNTGMFDRNTVNQFIANLDRQTPEMQQQWYVFEEYIKNDRLRNKYNTLISKGYYIPTALAKLAFENENNKASIEFISKKFVDIKDSLISPTDDDYAAQFEKNKEQYKQDAFREFDYVVFDILPSARDLEGARKEMNSIYEEFKTTDDIARFVLINSDVNYDSSWKVEGSLPVDLDSVMFNSEIGTVVEPYLVNNTFYTARLADVAYRPDSLKASHILISYQGAYQAAPDVALTKEQAGQLADSLQTVIRKSPAKFEELAKQFSTDPSAAANNGDLGWFADGRMVAEFNETVINGKIGSFEVAETLFGYHVINITGKKDAVKKVRVAVVETEVIPSSDTYQQIFAQASKLASENRTIEDFDASVESERLNKRSSSKVREMGNRIPGLNSPRQIIRWAFGKNQQIGEVEVGDISNVFDLDDQFVVAVLTNKTDEGYPSLEEIKPRLKNFVNNELKGELIAAEMESLNYDFDNLVAAGYKKDEMAALTFDSRNILGFGTEGDVIGTVFGKNEGDQFGPVIGKGGVFLVKVGKIVSVTEQDNYLATINKLQAAYENRVNQGFAYRALEEASEIEDRRVVFY